MKMIFNLVLRLYGLIVVHLGSFNSNSILYLFSDFFFGFLNNILFVSPLFGLCLASPWSPYSLKPHTLGSPPKGMGYEGVDCNYKLVILHNNVIHPLFLLGLAALPLALTLPLHVGPTTPVPCASSHLLSNWLSQHSWIPNDYKSR